MAKRPTVKQLAARKKFAAAVRAGKFRKKKKPGKKKVAKKRASKKRAKKKTGNAYNHSNSVHVRMQLLSKHLKLPHGYEIAKRKK